MALPALSPWLLHRMGQQHFIEGYWNVRVARVCVAFTHIFCCVYTISVVRELQGKALLHSP